MRDQAHRHTAEVEAVPHLNRLSNKLAPTPSSQREQTPEPAAAPRPRPGLCAGGRGGYLLTQVITFVSYIAFARLASPQMSAALIQRKDRPRRQLRQRPSRRS